MPPITRGTGRENEAQVAAELCHLLTVSILIEETAQGQLVLLTSQVPHFLSFLRLHTIQAKVLCGRDYERKAAKNVPEFTMRLHFFVDFVLYQQTINGRFCTMF